MNIRFRSYILLLLVALGSCKVSKDVSTPVASLPDHFRDEVSYDTTGIADIPWQKFFPEENLVKLINSAIVNNYDMQIALKNIDAAHLTLKQAKLGALPDIDAVVTAGSQRPSDNSLNGISISQFLGTNHIEDYSAGANLTWEADIWGKVRSKKAEALAQYLQTKEARKAIQTELIMEIAEGYYNLLMLDAQLDVARKNVRLNDSTLRIIRFQFDAGQVTSLAVQQAEAQQLAAAQLVPQFEQGVAIQENAISILTGVLPGRIERSEQLADIPVPESISAGVPSSILSHRPDVNSSELDLRVANANVGITKADLYPSLIITAQAGLNSFKTSNWFNIPASLFGAIAGGLTQPLFERKVRKTKYEIAKVEREKSVIRFRQTVLNAVGEVSDALVKIEKLQQQQSIAATRASTLQQAISNADMLYKNGMANYLEVITAQSNVLQSELELATIKKAQLGAVVELYHSVGGGWE